MLTIAICDDDQKELERTHELLKVFNREHSHLDCTVFTFVAPLELLSHVEAYGGFDIVIFDVYMAGILGTDAARELRQLGDQGEFILDRKSVV